ncbi:error-prone DNA polymerase [Marinobacter nanhaiticus D15-8W]|uniref:Error-prone DNA polymerase n=1 Tax=Marinobacter nanhaiticus D15-8W TaxID=626887 RepID=N6VW30_9GAMM|nr:error-prone DNA polymerase [Marinobacter nanhaiticus]ENO14425.1 error-prone DNA polymerase [Marinobacter nanhaiticus D15-8W]BES71815.1 error-prone DNA polymerase [Marinobacter nanhaiticus D15-8W]
MAYAELHCLSNFTFLRGASHPHELAEEAEKQGYTALAITDECSVAGMPRAYAALKANEKVKLITGSEFYLQDPDIVLVLLAQTRKGYGQLCQLITTARRRAEKGSYALFGEDLDTHTLDECLVLWGAAPTLSNEETERGQWLRSLFPGRLWIMAERSLTDQDEENMANWRLLGRQLSLPIVATGHVHMHQRGRQPLQDVLTAIRHGCTVAEAGHHLFANGERYLRPIKTLERLFPEEWLEQSLVIADRCTFSPGELKYKYPPEVIPRGHTPASYLRQLTEEGIQRRFPRGLSLPIRALVEKELKLIADKEYEPFFLTIHDIVQFARAQGILCQGRGSAANSVVCYCLGITEVAPDKIKVLFERFISEDRDEPPDIDVDFEHERREEVIQYIYRRYGRERAALAATVIRYRQRSAIRDVGKALGFDLHLLEQMIGSVNWRDKGQDWREQLLAKGIAKTAKAVEQFMALVNSLLGFPRHLSQHVGGFVISEGPLAELVPTENASMVDRTVIQWDKDDLESLDLMKVDVLALGMLSAIRKAFDLIGKKENRPFGMTDVTPEDERVYDMLCTGDSIGVFQVESRAQINMLPRLRPREYYDLVIQVAIVRPGPIQGDMVHPYLKRRHKLEPVDYPNDDIREVLERTFGVPIFQEQAIKLAMVAAGFSGSEADNLRRAMAAWKSDGDLTPFRDKLINGMRAKGYSQDFAEKLYKQFCGFGGYGFPESHSASFALLVYVSAWIKCHYPPVFYCALLNSQPMGFYSPSQLVQDARRHNVVVHPIDVNHSDWDHTLENQHEHLRLGLRLVKGLSRTGAEKLVASRPEQGYASIDQIRHLTGIDNQDLECLASAGALRTFSDNRHQARWDILEYDAPAPLFVQGSPQIVQESRQTYTVTSGRNNEAIRMPLPSEGEDILEDYASQGLTLQRHPLILLREQGHLRHCHTAESLKTYPNGRPVHVAGLVTGRQRPGSSKGVTFITLEDETGNTNVVVWLNTARQQRQPLIKSRLLHVKGILEREGDIVHVIAGKLTDLSHLLGTLKVRSRDFR